MGYWPLPQTKKSTPSRKRKMNPSSFGIFHTTFPQSCSFITSFKWMQKVWKHRTNTKSCYLLFNITINRWKNIKWDQKKTLILILTLNSMIELLSNIRKLQISSIVWLIKTIMLQCLFKEVYQCYISSTFPLKCYLTKVLWRGNIDVSLNLEELEYLFKTTFTSLRCS